MSGHERTGYFFIVVGTNIDLSYHVRYFPPSSLFFVDEQCLILSSETGKRYLTHLLPVWHLPRKPVHKQLFCESREAIGVLSAGNHNGGTI